MKKKYSPKLDKIIKEYKPYLGSEYDNKAQNVYLEKLIEMKNKLKTIEGKALDEMCVGVHHFEYLRNLANIRYYLLRGDYVQAFSDTGTLVYMKNIEYKNVLTNFIEMVEEICGENHV